MNKKMIKTIDAVYDENENKYYTVCPFCGDRVSLANADARHCCEHFIFWCTDDEYDAPSWELPESLKRWIFENPEAMTKWHDEFTEWFWEEFLPETYYVDDASWDDEGCYDASDHFDPETDSYEAVDFNEEVPSDGWYDFWDECIFNEKSGFTAEDLQKVLIDMGYDELAGKMVVVKGERYPEEPGTTCWAVYLPEKLPEE